MPSPESRLIARAAKGEDIRADAQALVDRKKQAKAARSRRPVRRVAGPSRKEAREAKRAAHREETRALREQLITLVGETCERCGFWAPRAEGHMHHTVGGIGRRRQEQSIENVGWVCPHCHGHMHRQPVAARAFAEKIKAKRAAHPEARSSASEAGKV